MKRSNNYKIVLEKVEVKQDFYIQILTQNLSQMFFLICAELCQTIKSTYLKCGRNSACNICAPFFPIPLCNKVRAMWPELPDRPLVYMCYFVTRQVNDNCALHFSVLCHNDPESHLFTSLVSSQEERTSDRHIGISVDWKLWFVGVKVSYFNEY